MHSARSLCDIMSQSELTKICNNLLQISGTEVNNTIFNLKISLMQLFSARKAKAFAKASSIEAFPALKKALQN